MVEILLNDGTPWSPSVVQMDSWRLAFKTLDLDVELAEIAAYCLNNPTKRWTRRGISNAVHANLRNKNDRSVSRDANNVARPQFGKGERPQPKASIDGDELRHIMCGEEIMRSIFNKVEPAPMGDFKFNLRRMVEAIIEGEREKWSDEAQYQSACFGALRTSIMQGWRW